MSLMNFNSKMNSPMNQTKRGNEPVMKIRLEQIMQEGRSNSQMAQFYSNKNHDDTLLDLQKRTMLGTNMLLPSTHLNAQSPLKRNLLKIQKSSITRSSLTGL